MSCIALFAALSGTAFALDGENTVGSDDIKPNAVRSQDLAPDSVTFVELANDAANSSAFLDGAVNSDQMGSIAQTESTRGAVEAGESDFRRATCPGKGQVITGGYIHESGNVQIRDSEAAGAAPVVGPRRRGPPERRHLLRTGVLPSVMQPRCYKPRREP